MKFLRFLPLLVLLALVQPAHAILDTNSNGISDLFEKQFNNNQLFSPGDPNHDPSADPDADGWSNLLEASAGTNPFNSQSPGGKVIPAIEAQTAPGAFIVSWPTIVGKAYQLQQSESLSGGSWIPVGPARLGDGQPIEDLLQPQLPGGGATAPKMFYRVLINDYDQEGDGLSNTEEHQLGLNPASDDSDLDGLVDKAELLAGTNPLHSDSDLDGVLDGVDTTPLTNNNSSDPDGHLMLATIGTDLVAWWDFQNAPTGGAPANYASRPNTLQSCSLALTGGNTSPISISGKSTFSFSVPSNAATNQAYMLVGGYKRLPTSGGTIAIPYSDFKGRLDCLMVHRRHLTVSEIQSIYQRDRDSDTLPDRLEATSVIWRDTDNNKSPSAGEYSYIAHPDIWQSPTTDSDQDSLSNTSEQLAGTDPFDPDTDGELMHDAWEIANGLDPLNPADALLDNDTGGPDGLTNLDEYRRNTDPKKRDTDGDGINDGAEAKGPDGNLATDDGSDPADSGDGGTRRPADQLVTFNLGVGDRSTSHSEDYVLNVCRVDPASGAETRVYTLRSGGFGQYASETRAFRKGDTYSFQIQWMGTSNATGSSALDSADWDYHMVVTPQGTDHGGILIDSFSPGNIADPIDSAHPLLDAQDTTPESDNDDNIADFPNTLQKKRVLFYTIRLHSVDRMFAAAVPVIPGLERMELHITDSVTGKDFGTHGYLLGGGSTHIYNTLAGMLGDEDNQGEDVTDPGVWFLRENNSRTTQFYLVSGKQGNPYGTIRIEASLGGVAMGAFQRALVQNTPFANNIQLLTDIAAGVGLAFSEDPAIQDGQGILNPEGWATPGLIPLMMIGHSVENLGIALQGIVYGVGSGLDDDWQFLVLCGKGIVHAGDWSIQQAQMAIHRWRSDPKGRLAELKETLLNAADELMCRPLEGVQNRMATPEGFISTVWEVAPFINPVTGPSATIETLLNSKVGTDLGHKAADGMVDWMYDFHSRMVDGAEKAAWLETPLSTDSLTSSDLALVRTCAYGFGHTFGYLCEQVFVGAVTGGAAVVGKIVIKNGVKLTGKLAARTLAMVAARSTLLKRQLASVAMSVELRIAVEESLIIAGRTPALSGKPALEVIENGFAGLGAARSSMNWKVFIEKTLTLPRLTALFETGGANALYLEASAEIIHRLGTQTTEKALRNWPKMANALCPLGESGLADDLFRFADLRQALKLETSQGQKVLVDLLEGIDSKTAQQLIDEGVPMPASIEDLDPTMYHYTSDQILDEFATDLGAGVWSFASRRRFITSAKIGSESEAQNLLQLPLAQQANGSWTPLSGKGRFRVEIDTADLGSSVKIPQADLHSGQTGVRSWVQPLLKDNPVCGNGGVPQFTSDGSFTARVFDTQTGQYITDKNHLYQILGL